jgi:hypothetical protein
MRYSRSIVLAFLLLVSSASVARADGFIIPFLGVNFAGDSGKAIGDAIDANRLTWGGSLGWMGGGVFGIEADFGHSSDFFGKSDLEDTSVTTLTGNLMLGLPFGGQQGFGIRPYGVVGLGLIKTNLEGIGGLLTDADNNAGWDVGGGVLMFFGRFGIRGDVRYFRTFSALDVLGVEIGGGDDLDFGRATAGFVVRF